MKALRFEKFGDVKNLQLVDLPVPKPGEGQVLVQVKAGGLNQSDVSNVLGKHPHTTLPRTPGRDFAGVVVEGPAHLKGKAVWGSGREFGFTSDGSHAEYLCAGADAVALKPESLSFAQAASCGVPYTTALSALERCKVAKGTQLLVIGAAGAVGSAAVAIARSRGAEVVGAVRHAEQAAQLAERGARAIVISDAKSLGQVKNLFAKGAEVVFDTTGAWLAEAVGVVAQYGRIGIIVAPSDGNVTVPVRDLYRRAASIIGTNSTLFSGAECARLLAQMGEAFAAGTLAPPAPPQERPLATGVEVYAEVNKARHGKIVFV
jgi:NADPH2:quinone reductase